MYMLYVCIACMSVSLCMLVDLLCLFISDL